MRVENLTSLLEASVSNLRSLCQVTLINAMSHERMTPLNKIMSLCKSIAEKASSITQCRDQANLIWDSCERMRLMTESQIMHLQQDCQKLQPKITQLPQNSLQAFYEDCLKPFVKDIEISGLKVSFDFSSVP